MKHILVGDSSGDPQLLFEATTSGALEFWVVPKNASAGDQVIFYLPAHGTFEQGFFAKGLIHTPPDGEGRRHVASIRSVTAIHPPVPIKFVREDWPEAINWGWPGAYTLSYTTPPATAAEQLEKMIAEYQRTHVGSPPWSI